jgi:hypothetical protein
LPSKSFPCWDPNNNNVGALSKEVQVQQAQDLVFNLRARFMMAEVERFDAQFNLMQKQKYPFAKENGL